MRRASWLLLFAMLLTPQAADAIQLLGRRVRTLLDEDVLPGRRELRWDGRGATGDVVGAGIYFARLTSTAGQRVERVVLLR